jgi:beta-ureidopropionase / N-carbamoyl-L-amino-acid hydrolase
MRSNLTPDIDLAERLFAAMRERTFDGVGITREAYGEREQIAHDLTRAEAEALGLECKVDHAGNLTMTLPGTDRGAKQVVLGSHLDSVPQGGNYDGAAGVLAGLASVAGMKRAGFVPTRDITVIAVRAEEAGAWFPTSYPGSKAALGTLPPEVLALSRLDTGRSLEAHMREAGFDPDAVRAGKRIMGPDNVAAYLELHIEQGPVLEAEQIPLGIVTGIPGSRRLRNARVFGEYNHSGTTPRRYRADAAIALAELAHRVDDYWWRLEAQGHAMVVTFCVLGTTEDAGFTKIAGEAQFQLDVRSVSPASVDALYAEMNRLIPLIEARRNVRFDLGTEAGSQAALMDAGVQSAVAAAANALGVKHLHMASGAGHDAAAFAQAGIPAGMIFVRNQNGSHNPHEAMRMEDFAAATSVMQRWAADLAGGA